MTDWTLVSRKRGGRFFRPVGNVPAGLDWDGARKLAQSMPFDPDNLIWYVPSQEAQAHGYPEDRDNILQDNGKRVPIRWDAAPLVSAPVRVTPKRDAFGEWTVRRSHYVTPLMRVIMATRVISDSDDFSIREYVIGTHYVGASEWSNGYYTRHMDAADRTFRARVARWTV